jgi:hypothetical protein
MVEDDNVDGAIFEEIVTGIVSYFQNYVFGPKPFMKKIKEKLSNLAL